MHNIQKTFFPTEFVGEVMIDNLDEDRIRAAANAWEDSILVEKVEPWHGMPEHEYKELQEKAWQKLRSAYENRRLLFQDVFRIATDHSHDALIGEKELFKTVDGALKLGLSDIEKKALYDKIFPKTMKRMSLEDFIKICEGTSTFLVVNGKK